MGWWVVVGGLLAGAPSGQDKQHVIDAHDSIKVDVSNRTGRSPETYDCQDIVDINDAIAIRSMMNLCMSFDHRINDGAESSTFLQAVKRRIEAIDADTPVY